jgi:protein subunit release factor B
MLSRCFKTRAFRLDTAISNMTSLLRMRIRPRLPPTHRFLHTTPVLHIKSLPPRPTLHDDDITEKFLHGSGPGGQKINKTSSAVQLKHLPTGIVVKYQDTRSRTVNRKMARKILQEKIEELELGDEARTKVKQREKSKKRQSAEKKRRRKYRKLVEGKDGEDSGEGAEGAEEGDMDGGEAHGVGVEVEGAGKVLEPEAARKVSEG